MTRHSRVALLGAALLVGGLVAAHTPLSRLARPPDQVTSLLFVAVVGAAAAYGGARAVRWTATTEQAGTADVEHAASLPPAGDALDERLANLRSVSAREADRTRRAVWERLREVAVALVRDTEGIAEGEARDRVDAGDWCDHSVPAEFLAGDLESVEEFRSRVDRTVQALLDTEASTGPTEHGGDAAEEVTDPDNPVRLQRVTTEQLRETGRLRAAVVLALVPLALGVALGDAGVLLAAVVGIGLVGLTRVVEPPEPAVALTRSFGEREPRPGEEVTVSVTVENTGESLVPDLRVVDGVPAPLRVTEGTPRFTTALRPGESARFSYTIRLRRGEFTFDPVHLLARDVAGVYEREATSAAEADTLTCLPTLTSPTGVPLRDQTDPLPGRVRTDIGGPGTEFFAVREYQPGDAVSRIDWKRYAKTGDLATVEFRQERSATVVLLVDVREEAYVTAGERNAVEHALEGAEVAFSGLMDAGNRCGIAAIGPRDARLSPSGDRYQRPAAEQLLTTHPAFSRSPPEAAFDGAAYVEELLQWLPASAQVVLVSPLVDQYPVALARELAIYGHATTVLSPDPTMALTTGQRLAGLERRVRLRNLRSKGLRVIDWRPTEHVGVAIERAKLRWES